MIDHIFSPKQLTVTMQTKQAPDNGGWMVESFKEVSSYCDWADILAVIMAFSGVPGSRWVQVWRSKRTGE